MPSKTSPIKAHVHCMENLPKESIRTVPAKHKLSTMGFQNPKKTQARHEKIMELHRRGWQRERIASELGISRQAVGAHISGRIKCCK